jgi:hypothetical protein
MELRYVVWAFYISVVLDFPSHLTTPKGNLRSPKVGDRVTKSAVNNQLPNITAFIASPVGGHNQLPNIVAVSK